MIYPISKRKLTVGQQLYAIRSFFSDAKITNKNGNLKVLLTLQPTPFSRMYPIEIHINKNHQIQVWLVGNIQKIDDPDFPHCYEVDTANQRARLCLYHPQKYEWNRSMSVADTLIPWTCEWLFHYELWLDQGIWYGGGEHPGP